MLDDSEGKQISAALGDHKALLRATTGCSPSAGASRRWPGGSCRSSRSARCSCSRQAAGELDEIPEPVRSETAALVGSPGAALINAKPMLDWIARVEPDMYD